MLSNLFTTLILFTLSQALRHINKVALFQDFRHRFKQIISSSMIRQSPKQSKQLRKEEASESPFSYLFDFVPRRSDLNAEVSKQKAGYFNQNSLIWISRPHMSTLFIPAYLRCHFRTMTEMDIQNLSCSFYATMNISFYLGKYQRAEEASKVRQFAEQMHQILLDNLKITFQNDFVLNIEQDLSSNVSDSDRLVRSQLTDYTTKGITRFYSNLIITRQFKFGLHSDIFFFPLQQNILDLVTTLNPIKTKMDLGSLNGQPGKQQNFIIRFNCMNLQIGQKGQTEASGQQKMEYCLKERAQLIEQLKQLYMEEHKGQQLTEDLLRSLFIEQTNHPFFRDIKISFPLKQNATEFGYYNIIEKDVRIHYTRNKQLTTDENWYQKFKNCIFCKKKVVNYDQNTNILDMVYKTGQSGRVGVFQKLSPDEDRSKQASYCNAIMSIPLLKASLGIIIQLCIPIFFLSFLTLVQFLYSTSTTLDQVRGQKIGSSTLIVATYISFIYLMRTVIPPTPSWSLFEVAVCLLAASSLAPIIQSIYQDDVTNNENPFLISNGLFIVSFALNSILCGIIVIMLLLIKIYVQGRTKRHRSVNVSMEDLLNYLTKKYFYLWSNSSCKDFLAEQLNFCAKEREATVRLQPQ